MALDVLGSGLGTMQLKESDVVTEAMDFFKGAPREVSTVSGRQYNIRPNDYSHEGPFTFEFTKQGVLFYQLCNSRLLGKVRVVNASDGSKLPEYENVSGINLFPYSLFSDIKLEIGGKMCAELTQNHYGMFMQ